MIKRELPVILIIMMLAAGCATSGPVSNDDIKTQKALNVSTTLKFDDVPVPVGFNIIASQSFAFENDVLRVGILKYTGRANGDQVVSFYKDQMPLYNWRFTNILEYGKRILSFERDDQSCIIVVEPSRMSTSITVTVSPKSDRAVTYRPVKKAE